MKSLKIEIETTESRLDFDLVSDRSVKPGQRAYAPGGGQITWEGRTMLKGSGLPETITLLLSFGKDVAIGVFASWLYDTLKGRARRLRIDRLEVDIDKVEIERVIQGRVGAEGGEEPAREMLAAVKPIRLSAHAQAYRERREFTVEEVEMTIRNSPWTPAELGRLECRLDLSFGQIWNGKQYETKQIRPIFIEEPAEILVVTVYTYYF